MVFVAVLLGAAVLCCSVLLVFGCVCHIFKRHGFTSFEDDVEGGRNVSMYPRNGSTHDVTFEPLPDILAKTVSSRALRPRITCTDHDKQETAAKLVTVYRPFPRNQLLYVKEIGLGWFGQVLEGSAEGITTDRQNNVVVKILKDDATPSEKALFLEEIAPYRDLESANIVQLLGQCTETSPFLAILEYPPLGDLKTYLLNNKAGPFIQFAIDAAKGLACMHKHSYVHHDFAARSCVLMSDMTVKIGDYGIGEDLFREDYYDTGRDLLPIRWMSPESLELKQGVWQTRNFTFQSNVWSLSVLLWEILTLGRKPFNHLRDEDVLLKVVREGSTKLPPPNSDIPLHDRWYEIMEMCWQEADDRPSADDILAFLQQIDEEVTSQSYDLQQTGAATSSIQTSEPVNQPQQFDTNFVMTKNKNHSSQHVAEVLVHRADNDDNEKKGFDDDFSTDVAIRKNRASQGFEDDFVAGTTLNDSDLPQNDSIIASGGNGSHGDDSEQEGYKDIFAADHNLNLLHPPVPVKMSTPSKHTSNDKPSQPESSTVDNQTSHTSSSKYTTANDGTTLQTVSSFNSDLVRADHVGNKTSSKNLFDEKSVNQTSDEGYRTAENGSAPDIVLSPNQNDQNIDALSKFTDEDSEIEIKKMSKLSPKLTDLETERAKELYMSKGIGLPPSTIHKSRSLGTIPEDGIPSDNTSQSGIVFDDPEESEEVGMNFEWDDYEGEQLVGRVRYMSDESTGSVRSPRHVEVEEWPFDQDSGSESHSKPASIASDSDVEVTRLSIGSSSSIDTRARIASILTNRLNSLIKQTNSSSSFTTSGQSMYSFSEYDHDADSPERAFTDTDYAVGQASGDTDLHEALGMPTVEEVEERETTDDELPEELQGQSDQLMKGDLDQIAERVLGKHVTDGVPEVVVRTANDHMLPADTHDSLA